MVPCASLTATRVTSFDEDTRRYFRVPEAVGLLYIGFALLRTEWRAGAPKWLGLTVTF